MTFEKKSWRTRWRLGYISNYGDKQREIHYNDSTPNYIWYVTKKDPDARRRILRRGDPAL